MDTVTATPAVVLDFTTPAPPSPMAIEGLPLPVVADVKLAEVLLDAVKKAVAEPGEHRLYRAGKLAGLFPIRTGIYAEAALAAITEGLLETVRTETKGKMIVEWVRVTPKGVAFVHDRDSPKAVLRELREVIGQTRAGVPLWMDDAKQMIDAVSERFERQSSEMLRRLDWLAERVDSALRRADLARTLLPDPLTKLVPWANDALAYLDRRTEAGAAGACPLDELFDAIGDQTATLTVPEFHTGLQRLHHAYAIRLMTSSGTTTEAQTDPEYALLVGNELCSFVLR